MIELKVKIDKTRELLFKSPISPVDYEVAIELLEVLSKRRKK